MHTDSQIQHLVDGYGNWVQQEGENKAGCSGGMTKNLFPYSAIFSPIQINRTTVKNRVVMAPMGNLNMAEETGRPSAKMLEYFFARAKGGCGLLSVKLKTDDETKIKKAVDALNIFRIGVSWGGYESLILPLLATKGDPRVIRLHIGLENTDSLIADLDKGLFLLK